ncbi:MAG: YcxB family protein [Lachnospiraceae bacterium]|nr:YcxB family protein [Lachnospiraceae bacterium]
MKRIVSTVLLAICLVGAVVPAKAGSKEIAFKDHDFSVTVSDEVLAMNSETNKYDPVWIEAGIPDAEERLDMMKQMKVLTILFDKKTDSLVNVICKMTEDTVKIFSYEGKTDEEVLASVDSLMEGIDAPDENGNSTGVTYERSVVRHDQIPFFRIMLDIDNPEMRAKEVIYGSVVNGRLIEVDQFLEEEGEIDETFIKSVVDSIKISKFMTPEEYEELIARNKVKIWIFIGVIILMIVGLFVFVTLNRKKKEKKMIRISDNLRDFRDRKARGEVDTKNIIATGRAQYGIKAIEKYIVYNTWIRNAVVEILLFAFLALIVAFCLMSDSILYGLLVAACGIVSLYFNYSGGNKNKANMIARYDARNNPMAKFTFYEEFFTVTGAGAMAEYTYDQVMSVRVYNEYLYIFFGTEQGVFVERNTVGEEELVKLVSHIKSHRTK